MSVAERFIGWLSKDTTLGQDRYFTEKMYLVTLLEMQVIGVIFYVLLGFQPPAEVPTMMMKSATWVKLLSIFTCIAGEDMLYRLFPLSFAVELTKNKSAAMKLSVLIITTLIFSTLFGLTHGDARNIPAQGSVGVLMSLVFLKCGGMKGSYVRGLAFGFFFHVILDIPLFARILGLILLG